MANHALPTGKHLSVCNITYSTFYTCLDLSLNLKMGQKAADGLKRKKKELVIKDL